MLPRPRPIPVPPIRAHDQPALPGLYSNIAAEMLVLRLSNMLNAAEARANRTAERCRRASEAGETNRSRGLGAAATSAAAEAEQYRELLRLALEAVQ